MNLIIKRNGRYDRRTLSPDEGGAGLAARHSLGGSSLPIIR